MVFAIFERNHVAIRGFSKNLEHFAGKNPVVPMQDSRSRFDDDACHGNFNVQRPTPNVQSSVPDSSVMPSEVETSLICLSREIPRLRCTPLGTTKASLEKTQSCPMQNSCSRFDDDACHEKGMLAQSSSARGSRLAGFWKLSRTDAASPP